MRCVQISTRGNKEEVTGCLSRGHGRGRAIFDALESIDERWDMNYDAIVCAKKLCRVFCSLTR